MKIVHIEVTTRCNLRCRHCRVNLPGWLRAEDIPMAAVERALAFAATWPAGAYCILQGHGEPLVHPDYPALFARACATCWRGVEFQTNGLLLCPELIDSFCAIAQGLWKRLKVSIDGPDAETYRAMRPGADFAKLLANLAHLGRCAVRPGLTIECVITRLNLNRIGEMPAFAQNLGADILQLSPFSAWPGAEELTPTPDELRLAMDQALARQPATLQLASPCRPDNRALCPPCACGEPRNVLFVAVDGSVFPCCRLREPLGNLATQEIAEIMDGEPRQKFLAGMATHPICGGCQARRARV